MNAVAARIKTGRGPIGVGTVIRIDTRTGRVSGHVLTGVAPRGIAFGAGSARVANSGGASVSRVVAG